MAEGKIFGTSGEVFSLANVTRLCMSAIEENNQKGQSLLTTIEGAQGDAVYRQAEEIVEYVSRAVSAGQEPLNTVISCLNQYAALLESHGK